MPVVVRAIDFPNGQFGALHILPEEDLWGNFHGALPTSKEESTSQSCLGIGHPPEVPIAWVSSLHAVRTDPQREYPKKPSTLRPHVERKCQREPFEGSSDPLSILLEFSPVSGGRMRVCTAGWLVFFKIGPPNIVVFHWFPRPKKPVRKCAPKWEGS